MNVEAQIAPAVEQSETRAVRAIVFKIDESAASETAEASKAVDPFDGIKGDIISPPIDLLYLSKLAGMSSELGPAVEAMETNVDGFGYQFNHRIDPDHEDTPKKAAKAIREEARRLRNTFKTFCRGRSKRISFTALRRRTRRDYELTGNAFWEALRSPTKRLVAVNHVPSHQIRIVRTAPVQVEVQKKFLEEQPDGTFKVSTYTDFVTFKLFVQGSVWGAQSERRYFKEFGDPRILDKITGKYIDPREAESNFEDTGRPMPANRKAGELIHFALYCPWSPYGVPRWYGALLSVLGARGAEEVNWVTLKNNNIPSLALVVSNGRLTEATIQRVQQFVESHIKGNQNYSQILLLEGESGAENDTTNQVKIDFKPLVESQHTDQLFTEYIRERNEAVRRSFRFSGIFTGHTDGLTKAVADSARRLGDEQTFAPERDEFDYFMNEEILPELEVVYHEFASLTPNITDNAEQIAMMATAERCGAMTPRRSDSIIRTVFRGLDRFPLKGDYDLDTPFSMAMAEAVQNKALSTEVGQQVAPTQPSGKDPSVDPQQDVKKSDDGALEIVNVVDRMVMELRRALVA